LGLLGLAGPCWLGGLAGRVLVSVRILLLGQQRRIQEQNKRSEN
jgi:hypothetical protein